jgi:aminoglycoside N3'-acetyltransferase
MRETTKEQVVNALIALGVGPGDGLLVHSAIQFLGRPIGGVAMYFDALCDVVGINAPSSTTRDFFPSSSRPTSLGTLVVPTFNFSFAHGEPYDPLTTPSVGMGAFSEYIRLLPDSRRTLHPMQSLAVVGRFADDLAERDTLSAFDPGSAFEHILELDFKLLLLGADVQAVSMLHYSEQRAHVPYRYWKDFTGQVHTPAGWEARTYRMFVRDLKIDPHIELFPVQELMQTRGYWSSVPLNYGLLSLCRLDDFVKTLDEFLAEDPWSLVSNRPDRTSDKTD